MFVSFFFYRRRGETEFEFVIFLFFLVLEGEGCEDGEGTGMQQYASLTPQACLWCHNRRRRLEEKRKQSIVCTSAPFFRNPNRVGRVALERIRRASPFSCSGYASPFLLAFFQQSSPLVGLAGWPSHGLANWTCLRLGNLLVRTSMLATTELSPVPPIP